jgi:D-beta-D-heptose 7-phosphate kinase/D-beta-D-heptose 1-phosphate adenosyltransferase
LHIVSLFSLSSRAICNQGEFFILDTLQKHKDLSGIIFEDYDKGALSDYLIKEIINFAHSKNIPIFVDPKFENFFSYSGATLLKPNKKEAKQALKMNLETESQIIAAGKELINRLDCEYALLTLGSEGMMLFDSNGSYSSVKTKARRVSDVSGAGDTVIATLAAYYCAGADIKEAATLANNAAGLVDEKPGIVSIDLEELYSTIEEQ